MTERTYTITVRDDCPYELLAGKTFQGAKYRVFDLDEGECATGWAVDLGDGFDQITGFVRSEFVKSSRLEPLTTPPSGDIGPCEPEFVSTRFPEKEYDPARTGCQIDEAMMDEEDKYDYDRADRLTREAMTDAECEDFDTAKKPAPTVGNADVQLSVRSPLLRPGLEIRVNVSRKYAEDAARDLIELAREINAE